MSEFKFGVIYDILKNRISEVINSEEINLANISVEKLEELDKYILNIEEEFDMYLKEKFGEDSYLYIKITYGHPYSKIEDGIFKIRREIGDIIRKLKFNNSGKTTEKYTIDELKYIFPEILGLLKNIPKYMDETDEYDQKRYKLFKDAETKKIKKKIFISLVSISIASIVILTSIILPLSILHAKKKKKEKKSE